MPRSRIDSPAPWRNPVLQDDERPIRDPHAIVFEVEDPAAADHAAKSFATGAPDGPLAQVMRYVDAHRGRAVLTRLPLGRGRAEAMTIPPEALAAPDTLLSGVIHLRLADPGDGDDLVRDLTMNRAASGVRYAHRPAIQYPQDVRAPRPVGRAALSRGMDAIRAAGNGCPDRNGGSRGVLSAFAAGAAMEAMSAVILPSLVSEQWALDKCGFPAVWPTLDAEDPANSLIAVIDQGPYNQHPELDGRVIEAGIIQRTDDAVESPHASAVAAVIAARRAASGPDPGMSGCCSAKILLYNAWTADDDFDSLAYYNSLLEIKGRSDVDVVNISLGSIEPDDAIERMIGECVAAGKIIVAAAGNHGNQNRRIFPAEYPDVIAVGATSRGDRRMPWSANSNAVFISAPGDNILSTLGPDTFGFWDGTSFAAPIVSSAIWMMLRTLGKSLVRTAALQLLQGAVVGGGPRLRGRGFGRLDAGALAKLVAPMVAMPSASIRTAPSAASAGVTPV